MAQYFFRENLPEVVGTPVIGVNSGTITRADPLYIDSNGFMATATAGSLVYGFALADYTLASTNQTVAKVKPQYIPQRGVVMVYTANQAVTQTNVGEKCDFSTTTSGAFVVGASSTGASGQVLIVGFDPNQDSTTTLAIVSVSEPQDLAYAQA